MVSQFPTPANASFPLEPSGPPYLKLLPLPDEYASIIVKEMIDKGATYGADTTNKVLRWEITYDGLTQAQAAILDSHRAEAIDQLLGFNFRDPRTNTLWTDVHYDTGWAADHSKLWSQSRTIILVKRPV